MKHPLTLSSMLLRLRTGLAASSLVALGSLFVTAIAAGMLAWTLQAHDLLGRERALARQAAALPVRPVEPPADHALEDNLALFRHTLGERRYAEQQVRALFGLADKAGLVLRQGEYREVYNQNARLYAYQVTLPVKGNYRAIWDFALQVLRAAPFASLDDIGFTRDAIGEPNVEARLRFTFYLADGPAKEGA
ncbi:MAG TPA: hypothetical protein VNT33_11245 [Telluria sp.]|nr:hypothetical protein [Telluria sp.]